MSSRRLSLIVVFFASFVLSPACFLAPPAWAAEEVKVQVCHRPPDNPGNYHTITVSANALPSHLAHGDIAAPCLSACDRLCEDGDSCTVDHGEPDPQDGRCLCTHPPVDCDDSNSCTADSCVPESGCVNTALVSQPCDDGQACTAADSCNSDGQCIGQPVSNCCVANADCTSPDACVEASCDLISHQCVSTPRVCETADLCSVATCNPAIGSCETAPVDCDDRNPQTLDTCNPATGECLHSLIETSACSLSATGQHTAFGADKNDGIAGQVPVPDDGTIRAGAPLRFRDNGDGTISDLNTGLMWEKKGATPGLHWFDDTCFPWSGDGTEKTIWDWLDEINAEGGTGFAGHNDWRIPNVRELLSIVRYGDPTIGHNSLQVAPEFESACEPGCSVLTCSCTFEGDTWTSSTDSVTPSRAWAVNFRTGRSDFVSKGVTICVRAVRGGA